MWDLLCAMTCEFFSDLAFMSFLSSGDILFSVFFKDYYLTP